MRSILAPVVTSLVLATGCGPTEYRSTVAVASTTPDLVYVAPGVQAIADYDEPIFYNDGFYWWSFGGTWYRSTSYLGGWMRIAAPPTVLVQIRNPHHYRHYRPSGYIAHRRPVPAHSISRPIVRDLSKAPRIPEYHP
jgi:hypothetical protein